MNLLDLAKLFTPPLLVQIYRSLRMQMAGKIPYLHNSYGLVGDFCSWKDAAKQCTGYESEIILNKCKDSLLKVKNGKAVYERDSVLFDQIEYSWPLLAGLMYVAAVNGGKLNVLDFGGSLGSTFFQNLAYLQHLDYIRWNIVEQKSFVDCGKEFFEDENLRFFYTINECLKTQKPNVIILSSVLQYLEKPYDLLEEIINHNIKYILIDRTYFSEEEKDKISVQVVPKDIYKASYPCWFFSSKKFLSFFHKDYVLISDFEDYAGCKEAKGFFFERKKIT